MSDFKKLKNKELKDVSGGFNNLGVPEFKKGDKVVDAEKILYTIESFDGVYCFDNNYTVIVDFIPNNVLPFTSVRVGDTYHISESRLRYYKG